MDRFFDRLGDIIKGFLDDDDAGVFGRGRTSGSRDRFSDPDLEAAFEELDDYLKSPSSASSSSHGKAWEEPAGSSGRNAGAASAPRRPAGPPESLRRDFQELGVPFGADEATCKGAYKKLLKIHHPDRHAGHAENMRKATEKSARINAAFQRIEHWRETGTTD